MSEPAKEKINKADLTNLTAYLPHIHVIAHGSNEEAKGVAENASSGLVKALSFVAKHQTGGAIQGFEGTGLAELLRSDERLDRKSVKLHKLVQSGGDVMDTLKAVGKTALQLAPALIPLLL